MNRKMKDSGIKWIGEIPEDWEIVPLKTIVDIYGRIGFRGYTIDDITEEGDGAITLSPTNIINGKLSIEKATYLSWKKYYESPEIMVKSGDIVFVKTASVGKNAIVENIDVELTINPQFIVFKNFKLLNKYLYYVLNSPQIQDRLQLDLLGGVIKTITQNNINNYKITLPTFEEQEKIADFLDQKVSEIDNIIEKTKESIEEYKKYKGALITETATKGLDKNVKMKDSGIEWIGEIPEHWKTVKISRVTSSYSGGTPSRDEPLYWINGTINWMSSGEVNNEYIYDTKEKISVLGLDNSSAKLFPINAVVVALNGQGKTKGMSAILKISTTTNQSLVGFICSSNILNYEY